MSNSNINDRQRETVTRRDKIEVKLIIKNWLEKFCFEENNTKNYDVHLKIC